MRKSRARILAVDDDPMNLLVLEELLAQEHELRTLDRGSGVLETAREFRPDLILLDIMMPDLTGYEVCRRLRDDPELRSTKVILVSAKAMVAERLEGYASGADDYVTKPFNLDEFMSKVRVYLRLKSAEELESIRGHYLTLLNHEARTPLTSILSASELMEDLGPSDEEERRDLLRIIRGGVDRLRTLLERLTLLNQLQGRELVYECSSLDAVRVLRGRLTAQQPFLAERQVTVALNGPPSALVQANEDCIAPAFDAVLHNAIRFSPPGGEVRVDVSTSNGVRISVTDRGPGIDARMLPHLWGGLRVADLDHHSMGQGLSLALARGLLEVIGGAIEVRSTPGEGACFTITLPVPEAVSGRALPGPGGSEDRISRAA